MKYWVRIPETLEPVLYDPETKTYQRVTIDELCAIFDPRKKKP